MSPSNGGAKRARNKGGWAAWDGSPWKECRKCQVWFAGKGPCRFCSGASGGAAGGGGGGDKGNVREAGGAGNKGGGDSRQKRCFHCGGQHLVKDCPAKAEPSREQVVAFLRNSGLEDEQGCQTTIAALEARRPEGPEPPETPAKAGWTAHRKLEDKIGSKKRKILACEKAAADHRQQAEEHAQKAREAEEAAAEAKTDLAEAEKQLASIACRIASNGSLGAIAEAWGHSAGIQREGEKWGRVLALVAEIDQDIAQAKADAQAEEERAAAADNPAGLDDDDALSAYTGDMRSEEEAMQDVDVGDSPAIAAVLAGAAPEQAQALELEVRAICKRAAQNAQEFEAAKRFKIKGKQRG